MATSSKRRGPRPRAAATLAGRGVFLFLVLVSAGCGNGAAEGLVATPTALDWSRVVRGNRVVRTFTLQNTFDRAIFVTEVKPNCKCIQVGPFQRNLQPGESRQVQVTLDASTLPIGELKGKKLDILSSDPTKPHLSVDIHATIYVTHTIAPEQRLDVGHLQGDRRDHTWRVHVRPVGAARIRLVRAVIAPTGIFDVRSEDVEDGHDLLIRVADGVEGEGAIQTVLAVELEVEETGKAPWRRVERIRVDGRW